MENKISYWHFNADGVNKFYDLFLSESGSGDDSWSCHAISGPVGSAPVPNVKAYKVPYKEAAAVYKSNYKRLVKLGYTLKEDVCVAGSFAPARRKIDRAKEKVRAGQNLVAAALRPPEIKEINGIKLFL